MHQPIAPSHLSQQRLTPILPSQPPILDPGTAGMRINSHTATVGQRFNTAAPPMTAIRTDGCCRRDRSPVTTAQILGLETPLASRSAPKAI
jgi:hypothetical protein